MEPRNKQKSMYTYHAKLLICRKRKNMAKWHITFTNMGVWHNIEAPTKQKAKQIVLNMLKEINAENSTHIQCITLQSATKKELEKGLNYR